MDTQNESVTFEGNGQEGCLRRGEERRECFPAFPPALTRHVIAEHVAQVVPVGSSISDRRQNWELMLNEHLNCPRAYCTVR